MTKQNRKVKLHSQSRPSQQNSTGIKQVPWLNVSGIWLEQAGFSRKGMPMANIGLQVEIIVRDKELIIKPLQ